MADTVLKDGQTTISCDQALRIARTNAESAYRDLSMYRIAISLEEQGWLVDFDLKDPNLQGGGPHYVIDAETGEILSKRHEQ